MKAFHFVFAVWLLAAFALLGRAADDVAAQKAADAPGIKHTLYRVSNAKTNDKLKVKVKDKIQIEVSYPVGSSGKVTAKSNKAAVKWLENYREVVVGAPLGDVVRVVAMFEAEKKGTATLTVTPPVGTALTVEVEVD